MRDIEPTIVISPKQSSLSPVMAANQQLLRLQSKDSQISVIHDEEDAKNINNSDLDQYEKEMTDQIHAQINAFRKSGVGIPHLASTASLHLDITAKQLNNTHHRADNSNSLSRSHSHGNGAYTPTLKTKETKELCEKLDNINVIVNEINQYIMNHKSNKIKNDEFIMNKLSEIQDDVEDAEMYMEEHIDKKFIEMDHSAKLSNSINDKQEKNITELNGKLQQQRQELQQLLMQTQAQSNKIRDLQAQTLQLQQMQQQQSSSPKSINFNINPNATPNTHSHAPSVISRLSSLSQINEMEEKEGTLVGDNEVFPFGPSKSNKSTKSEGDKYEKLKNDQQYEMNKLRKKLNYLQKEELMNVKRDIYEKHYNELNQFILKITQTGFKLLSI